MSTPGICCVQSARLLARWLWRTRDAGALMNNFWCCKVCGSRQLSPALTLATGGELRYVECSRCGLVFNPHVWDSKDVELLNQYWTRETVDRIRHDPILKSRNRAFLRSLAELVPTRNLLEIGCGAGNILRCAAEEGWSTVGTEVAPDAVAACRSQGLHVLQGDLLELRLESQAFGAVIMGEVIEHLISPKLYLREIHRLLVPGGVLYLTTPNYGSLTRLLIREHWRVFVPQHLQLFRPCTLRLMLRKSGFSLLWLHTRNIDPGEILNCFRGKRKSPEETFKQQLSLRNAVEASVLLRTSKAFTNFLLGTFGLGNTIVCTARAKPVSEY